MKRIFIIYIFLILLGQSDLFAQDINRLRQRNESVGNNSIADRDDEILNDSTEQEIDASSVPVELHMWTVDDRLGNIRPEEVDTIHHHYQNTNLTGGFNGEYNFLGNLGSPRESRLFFDRPEHTPFFFTDPYSFFIIPPEKFKFTNTKSPYTNLTYHKGGSKRNGEERFKAYFSVNVNKKLGIGFNADYLYGRGLYTSQSTAFFNGALFGSYITDNYNLHVIYSYNQLKMAENGGIEDDRYITDPLSINEGTRSYQTTDIPTRLTQTWNRNKDFYIFLTQRYNLGFERIKETPETTKKTPVKEEVKSEAEEGEQIENESEERETEQPKKKEVTEFIPVTSFIHTLKVEKNERRFISYDKPENLYVNNFFRSDSANDVTKQLSVKNTLALSLREGFSKWAKAGLTAFIAYEHRRYTLPDSINRNIIQQKYNENIVSVGGEFAKRQGRLLHYNINGDIALLGEDAGQFNLDGKLDLNFHLFNDTVRLDAHAFIKNINPGFYYRHFHSSYYWWNNNNLSKEIRTRIEGQLSIDRWRTQLKAGVENVKNYTYFANEDVAFTNSNNETTYKNNVAVKQASNNIQVFSATLKQDFKLGILHLDNEVTYQKSSDNTVLPLPEINLYHNLYISAKLAKKVLSLELGADMRYFTKYHAPDYSPVIGQYYQQNQQNLVEVGGYPIINVYANLHLKRTRIYVMMSHVNQGMGNSNYFLAPHYPVNPRMFQFGISWNFFD